MVDPKKKKNKKMAHPVETDTLQGNSSIGLDYAENPAAKRLLDAIVSILAVEYVETAKKNPEIFKD